jgi:hypothetical protein
MNDEHQTIIEKIINNEASKEQLEQFLALVESDEELKKAFEVERALTIAQKLLKKLELAERFKLINENESSPEEESESDKMIRYMNAAYENKDTVEKYSGADGLITYETIKNFLKENDDKEDGEGEE